MASDETRGRDDHRERAASRPAGRTQAPSAKHRARRAERRFGELVRLQDQARDENSDPCQQVRAGCLAYCEFGLAQQGHYQVMFANPLPMPADMPLEQFPGIVAFRRLVDSVAACLGAEPADEQTFFTALLIWQQLHGIVSLRISRPRFPWPPLAETVTEAVDRLLASADGPPVRLPHQGSVDPPDYLSLIHI